MMRKLEHITGDCDIYEPVPEQDIVALEHELGFQLPEGFRVLLLRPDLEFITALTSALLWAVSHKTVGILDVNTWLRTREFDPFPDFLIAFATNECGDYFCFDKAGGGVIYIDPDATVEENLRDRELSFESFDDWLDYKSIPLTS